MEPLHSEKHKPLINVFIEFAEIQVVLKMLILQTDQTFEPLRQVAVMTQT